MAKFSVEVTVTAAITYTVEVESYCESKAEDVAAGMWRAELPDDFQVDKGYISDWMTEAVQLTWECHECGAPISEEENRVHDEMCAACWAAAVAV